MNRSRYFEIGLAVLLMAAVVVVAGQALVAGQRPARVMPETPEPTPTLPSEAGMYARESRAAEYAAMPGEPNRRRTRAVYYARRAYPGAPPVIPHAVDEREAFAKAVRDVDYDAGREMFHPDAVGFGTFARMAVGRENLINEQWRKIWGCTRGFRFLTEDDDAVVHVENDSAWVATMWHSEGRDEHGQWFDRHGRTTLLLRRDPTSGRWLCVHSHYSRIPTPKIAAGATPA